MTLRQVANCPIPTLPVHLLLRILRWEERTSSSGTALAVEVGTKSRSRNLRGRGLRRRLRLHRRRRRPVFLVDTSLPGDIDPAINRIDEAFLYDLADLERVVMDGRATLNIPGSVVGASPAISAIRL